MNQVFYNSPHNDVNLVLVNRRVNKVKSTMRAIFFCLKKCYICFKEFRVNYDN